MKKKTNKKTSPKSKEKESTDSVQTSDKSTDISMVLPPGQYTRKEYVQALIDSGIGDRVASELSTTHEQQMAGVWWENIQLENKLDRSGKRDRISKEEQKFLTIKDKLPVDALSGKLDVFIIYIEEFGLKVSRSTAHRLWNKYRSR